MTADVIRLSGEFSLDLARGVLLRGAEPVHLRPQAYEALRFLAARPGRLVSKDALVEAVWQGRAVSDDSLVQCLSDVRQALGDSAGQQLRTVRGRGYILDIPGSPATTVPDATPSARVPADHSTPRPAPVAHVDVVSPVPSRIMGLARGLSLMAALAVSVVAAAAWLAANRPVALPRIESLAVLPFENEQGNRDVDYLADGLTESLISSLAHVPGLSVKARSSVFRFKGRAADPRHVAQALSVHAVLTGRVVQQGNALTLYVSLVEGRTGNQLWGHRYIHGLNELPAMQQIITRDVSEHLRMGLSHTDRENVTRDYPVDPDAYLAYLRGRHHARRTTEPDFRRAIEFYLEAINRDPTYALAYASMSDALRALSIVGRVPSAEAFPQARAAALQALALDPDLVEAHVALGFIAFSFDWQWDQAERSLRRAIELAPESADALRAYAHLLSNRGRHAEAVEMVRRARELDPLWLLTNALEGQFLFYGGRLEEAEERFGKTLELEPAYWVAHNGLGRVRLLQGRLDEAIVLFARARTLAPGSMEPVTQLGYALARAGRRAEAQALLTELAAMPTRDYVPAYAFAMIQNGLGNYSEALDQLERSLAAREVQITFIGIDRRWDPVRQHPRFAALARAVGVE